MRNTLTVFFTLFLLTAVLHAQGRVEFRPSPKFTGDALPAPPMQQKPWTPPQTTLPKEWISATETLFAQGLADPRGCEYAVIEIGAGNTWKGDAGIMAVHGWVLPGAGPQRFAVCWNGLIYPVVTVIGAADLAVDVRAQIEGRQGGTVFETDMVSHENQSGLKVCLLLRLGEGKAAEALWDKVKDRQDNVYHEKMLTDPYLSLASDWAWTMFERGVGAHMRGDDWLSVSDFQTLDRISKVIEAEAAKRGFERPMVGGERVPHAAYLQFLTPLPRFLADEARRVKTPRKAPFTLAAIIAEKDRTKRIAALIDGLDEVNESKMGEPGGVMLAWNPTVKALIAEGEAAVAPLIDCLEKDTRLTRSVDSGRSFFRDRRIVTVRGAAYAALTEILHTREFGQTVNDESAVQMAGRIRAYWEKVKGTTLEERWYNTLADDNATPKQWMEAAGSIVQPANIQGIPGSGYWSSSPLQPGETPPMRGESLRAKKNPSVSELMARRIPQIAKQPGQEPSHMKDVSEMALNLAKWDLRASLPVLRDQVARCRETRDYDNMLAASIGRLTIERIRGEDPQAASDYAAWLLGSEPTSMSSNIVTMLEPLWRYPGDRTLAAAAEKLFNDPASAWANLWLGKGLLFAHPGSVNSPLLGVPAFRRHVLTALADQTVAGKLNHDPKSWTRVELSKDFTVGYTIEDKNQPAITDQPVRVCDLYAMKLAEVQGMPAFKLEWLEAERDRVIADATERLRKFGERYGFDPALPKEFYGHWDYEARMIFPRLEQPATEENVRQGRAIIALPADAQRRVMPLPAVPLAGKWVTWQQYPYEQQTYNGQTNKAEYKHAYHQEVTVWQAEEMLVDGKWQRFYGAVGPHELMRIPAAEIELSFVGEDRWGELSNGFDCQAVIREGHNIAANAPLTLDISLRNRRGIDQHGPSTFNLPFDDGRPSLRPGMAIHLFFAPPTPDGRYPEKWDELPSKAAEGAGWRVNEAWKKLGPAESYLAVSLDLAKCFDLSRAGQYYCYVSFSKANPAFDFAEGQSSYFYFQIGK